jgi:hypothetical protein
MSQVTNLAFFRARRGQSETLGAALAAPIAGTLLLDSKVIDDPIPSIAGSAPKHRCGRSPLRYLCNSAPAIDMQP